MAFPDVANDLKSLRIKGWLRVWQPFMKKYNCDHICELGVFKGDNFLRMIQHEPKLAVAVDTWNNDGVHSPKDASYSKEELELQYEHFKNQVKNFPYVQIIRDTTLNAATHFEDNFFDFVYIDADHSYTSCYQDILAWYPKVKTGKVLAGHDYRRGFGVVDAVNKFVQDNNLELILLPPSIWAVIKK